MQVGMRMQFKAVQWLFISFLCLGVIQIQGQNESKAAPSVAEEKPPPLKEIGEGIFQIGEVRLDKRAKTVSFPGTVNLTNVVIEYAVVGSGGKLHESLLATQVPSYHIHLAALLLGISNRNATVESGQPLTGAPIAIWVAWMQGGKERKVRLEDLICKGQAGGTMESGIWLYNGSRTVQGYFMAQASESVISIIEDPDALINNPRQGRENDEIWFPNEKAVPPAHTPVTITFGPESPPGQDGVSPTPSK